MQGSDFLPSRDGFHFRNDFDYPASRLGRGAPLAQGYGLAGGMCLAALDRWRSGRPLPIPAAPLRPGDPLYEELVRRQVELLSHGAWDRIVDWQSRPGIGKLVGPRGVGELTRSEWRRVRRSLDAGMPVLLCVLRTRGPFANPSENPLVLAYRYEFARDTRRATVWVYDPNRPGNDDVRLTLALGGRRTGPETTYVAERVRGFLILAYDRPVATPLRALPADASQGAAVGRAAPLHAKGARAVVRARDGGLLLVQAGRAKDVSAVRVRRVEHAPLASDPVLAGERMPVVLARESGGAVVAFTRGVRGWRGRQLAGTNGPAQLDFGPVALAHRGRVHAFGVRAGRMLDLERSALGKWTVAEIPAQPLAGEKLDGTPTACMAADGVAHVFARTEKGRIAHMRRSKEGHWVTALLPALDSPAAGDPVAIVAPADQQITLFVVGENGELFQLRGAAGDAWRTRNLTRETAHDGGPHSIRVEIAVTSGPGNTLHVFGVSPRNGLVNYWCPPTFAWRAQNLTQGRAESGEEARVRGRPSVARTSDGQLVVALSGEQGLVVYRWSAAGDWTADPLPMPAGLTTAASTAGPVAWTDAGGRAHLLACFDDGRVALAVPGRPDAADRALRTAASPARETATQPTATTEAAPSTAPGASTADMPIVVSVASAPGVAAMAVAPVDVVVAEPEPSVQATPASEQQRPAQLDPPPPEPAADYGSLDLGSFAGEAAKVTDGDAGLLDLGDMAEANTAEDATGEESAATGGLLDIGLGSMSFVPPAADPVAAPDPTDTSATTLDAASLDDTDEPATVEREGWGSYAPVEADDDRTVDLGSMAFEPAAPLLPDPEAARAGGLELPSVPTLSPSTAKQEEEAKALAAEKRRAEEEEAERVAAEKRRAEEEEAKRVAAEKRRAEEEEAKRLAAEKQRAEEEAKRLAEEKRRAEEEARRVAAEKRKAEEEAKRVAAEKKKAEEAEAKRLAAEKKKAEEEAKRIAAEKRKAEEEAKRIAAEKKKAEEAEAKRLAAEKKKAEEAEARRVAAEKRKAEEEAKRLAAEKKKAEEAEAKRLAAEKKKAEEEAKRLAAEKKKAEEEEAKRLAAEKKRAEEEEAKRIAAEKKKAEEAEVERRKAEEAKAAARPARPVSAALEGLPLLDDELTPPEKRPKPVEPKETPEPKGASKPKPRLRSVDEFLKLSDEHEPTFDKK